MYFNHFNKINLVEKGNIDIYQIFYMTDIYKNKDYL